MVVVPAGEFIMGSPPSERGRNPDEGPQRKVTFAQPFAAGKYEVTFAQWDACVAEAGCTYQPGDNEWGRGKRPVINVSWNDAQQFVGWLAKKTGKPYRLLTEAEWEYAARGTTNAVDRPPPFSTGPTINPNQANYDGNFIYGAGAKGGIYRQKTLDVGSFKPNAFGLYDMHGNVWEWVEDCYQGQLRRRAHRRLRRKDVQLQAQYPARWRVELLPPAASFCLSLCVRTRRTHGECGLSRCPVDAIASGWR